ncbi:unnamed protein product [Rotaria sp. Silwood1]|nr:unnamed protein product [Rotaria sp. Silwood1]
MKEELFTCPPSSKQTAKRNITSTSANSLPNKRPTSSSNHVPDLLTILQNLINQRELTDLTTSKSIYDQNDTDIDMTDRSLTELTTMNNDNHHVQQKRSTK